MNKLDTGEKVVLKIGEKFSFFFAKDKETGRLSNDDVQTPVTIKDCSRASDCWVLVWEDKECEYALHLNREIFRRLFSKMVGELL